MKSTNRPAYSGAELHPSPRNTYRRTRPRHTIEPRLLNASEAARYLGFASTELLANVGVKPIQLATLGVGTAPRYDRYALDDLIDQRSGVGSARDRCEPEPDAQTEYDEWRRCREPRRN